MKLWEDYQHLHQPNKVATGFTQAGLGPSRSTRFLARLSRKFRQNPSAKVWNGEAHFWNPQMPLSSSIVSRKSMTRNLYSPVCAPLTRFRPIACLLVSCSENDWKRLSKPSSKTAPLGPALAFYLLFLGTIKLFSPYVICPAVQQLFSSILPASKMAMLNKFFVLFNFYSHPMTYFRSRIGFCWVMKFRVVFCLFQHFLSLE